MPRVYTQTKAKQGKERRCGRCSRIIQPGETYYRWAFRYGGERYACEDHRPRRSELTQSKMGDIYSAIESAEDELRKESLTAEDLTLVINGVGETVREIQYEYEEAAEPFGGAGDNQERADELDGFATDLETFDAEDYENVTAAKEQAQAVLDECPL